MAPSEPANSLPDWSSFHGDFVGKKLRYPSADPPAAVLCARNHALAIPADFRDLIVHDTSAAFSILPPNTSITECITRTLPSSAFILALEAAFGQAWFDGAQSILDFLYKGSRLPLYVISLWKEWTVMLNKRKLWVAADSWLDARSMDDMNTTAVREARTWLQLLPWNASLPVVPPVAR